VQVGVEVEVEAIDERMGQCACGRKKEAAALEGISRVPPGDQRRNGCFHLASILNPKNWT
jgi:hypothetical protein